MTEIDVIHLILNFSTPTVDNHPVAGFQPVKNGELNYLDIENEGLIIRKSRNDPTTEFYDYMRAKNQQILKNHPNAVEDDAIKRISRII